MLRRALAFALVLAIPASAEPAAYTLDAARSVVGFEVDFGTDEITGSMPVTAASVSIDFERPASSRVSVTLNAAEANASFPFATQALTGPSVLDTDSTPQIAFESTAFRSLPGPGIKAEMDGLLTIRGVTRPVTLDAEVFRQQGIAEGDRSKLAIHMSGTVSRAAFGADGWSDLVGDEVRLRIIARIDRQS